MKTKLNTLLPYKIANITKLKRHLMDREMKDLSLSRTQWQTLAWISILQTPCTQQALLKALELDRAQLARVLEQLDKKEIITRAQLPKDRRSLEINLTKKGEDLLIKVNDIMHNEAVVMSKGLSAADKKLLDIILDKMTSNLMTELGSN